MGTLGVTWSRPLILNEQTLMAGFHTTLADLGQAARTSIPVILYASLCMPDLTQNFVWPPGGKGTPFINYNLNYYC